MSHVFFSKISSWVLMVIYGDGDGNGVARKEMNEGNINNNVFLKKSLYSQYIQVIISKIYIDLNRKMFISNRLILVRDCLIIKV